MEKTVLAFGELLWDILPGDTILGGAPFNFIYRVNSLGSTGIMVSRLGRDNLGLKAYDRVVRLGIDTDTLQWDETYPTGTVIVSFDGDHNPDYVIVPNVAYDHIEMTGQMAEIASRADCICFGTLIQRAGKSRTSLENILESTENCVKFLDINFRKNCYNNETVLYSLKKADVLKLNENEVVELARILNMTVESIPDFCNIITETYSLSHCLVTLAEYGVYGCSGNGDKVYVPGYTVNLIDSLGSGDAFSAGFIHETLRNSSLENACMLGNLLGALVAAKKGATAPVTAREIETLKHADLPRNIRGELEKYIVEY